MTKSRGRILLLFIALQILYLLGVAGTHYAVALTGSEVKLKTAPIDPRDLFYGDYVALNYEINTISPSLWTEKEKPKQGDAVYVVLKPDPPYYKAVGAYSQKPALHKDEVLIKGKASYSWDQGIQVSYGIERYYVPEGTGKDLENKRKDLLVSIKIASWGQAQISSVTLESSP